MTFRRIGLVTAALATLVACESGRAKPAAPSVPAGAAPDADRVRVEAADAGARGASLVDLLYRTRSEVWVSSKVDNPRDFPEHLVDRNVHTAWNGRTGDLSPSIVLRVPASARVASLSLVVGFDAVGKEGDLFTMNHRIAEVRVEREGETIGTFALDPSRRTPQTIPIDRPGGRFTLRVTKTVPGTKPDWREVVVSELTLEGTVPDDDLLPPAMPQVTYDGDDRRGLPTAIELQAGAPYETLEKLCARHRTIQAKELARLRKEDYPDIRYAESNGCRAERLDARDTSLAPPFEDARILAVVEGPAWVERLAVKTARGWYPTDHVVSRQWVGPGCGMSRVSRFDSARVASRVLTVVETKHDGDWFFGVAPMREEAGRFFVACVLGDDGAPRCKDEIVASYDGDGAWIAAGTSTGRWPVEPPRWDWTRVATADSSGVIRLGPCLRAAGDAVPCRTQNAAMMRR